MKNANLLINGVLLIAVIILYFLHFSGSSTDEANNKTNTKKVKKDSTKEMPLGNSIVYINYDTLISQYKMLKEMEDDVTEEKLKLQGQLDYRMKQLQDEYMKFQEEARFMSQVDGEKKQQELMQKEQELMEYRQKLDEKLIKLETDKAKQVQKVIKEHLAQIQEEEGFLFILGTGTGSNVLQADSSLEITQQVVTALNQAYDAEKGQEDKEE